MGCSQHHLFAAWSWGKRVWENKKMAASNINAALKLLIVTAPKLSVLEATLMPKIEKQRRIAKPEQIGRVMSFSVWLHLSGLILRCLLGTRLLLGQRHSMPFTALVESCYTAPYAARGSLLLTYIWSQIVNSCSPWQKAIHMTNRCCGEREQFLHRTPSTKVLLIINDHHCLSVQVCLGCSPKVSTDKSISLLIYNSEFL